MTPYICNGRYEEEGILVLLEMNQMEMPFVRHFYFNLYLKELLLSSMRTLPAKYYSAD
jgi:hypothetical protein